MNLVMRTLTQYTTHWSQQQRVSAGVIEQRGATLCTIQSIAAVVFVNNSKGDVVVSYLLSI